METVEGLADEAAAKRAEAAANSAAETHAPPAAEEAVRKFGAGLIAGIEKSEKIAVKKAVEEVREAEGNVDFLSKKCMWEGSGPWV